MAFTLNSIITIGKYRFKGVHDVHIKKSIHSVNETCNIKIPTTARLRRFGQLDLQSIEVAKVFAEGDKVTVELGYNGKYNVEFVGFVRRIDLTTPCIIECEGFVYQLRNKIQPKSFVNTDYKEIVKYIIDGTDIVLSDDMKNQSLVVDKFTVKEDTAAETLMQLNKHLFNALIINFHGNVLYMGADYLQVKQTVKYKIGWNTIKDSDLRLREPGKYTVNIKLSGVLGDGSKNVVNVGDNSLNVQRKRSYSITDTASLKYLGELLLKKEKYTGYEGKIVAFGIPFCEHGWRIELTDPKYKEREGVFLADSVEVRYGMSGFRRIVGIGIKIS